MVPESVSTISSVCGEQRWVPDPEFYPYPRNHDSRSYCRPWDPHRKTAGRIEATSSSRVRDHRDSTLSSLDRHLPHRQANLDAGVDSIQRWYLLLLPGG